MKKIILFFTLAILTINSYSQKPEGDTWRQVAKYLFDEGFDRKELRNTVQLVRDMSIEIFEKKKISKRTQKKLKNFSFNEDQIKILKKLSQKMSKVVKEDQKKEKNKNPDKFKRSYNQFNRNERGGQRLRPTNYKRQGPARPEVGNPVLEKLVKYVRDRGVSKDNISNVMNIIIEIGKEYRSSSDKLNYLPDEDSIDNLKKAGLSNDTIKAVVEIIKALAVYDR